MRQCPGCSYYVPTAWTACKKCGADLPEKGDREKSVAPSGKLAARAPGATTAQTDVGASGGFGDYFAGGPDATRVDPGPAPGMIPGSLSDDGVDPFSGTGSAGASSSTSSRPRGLAAAVYALCAVVLVAAGWFGYRQITAEHIDLEPAAQAYVDGDVSVPIENAVGRFRAELPASPEVVDESMSIEGGTYSVHLEMSQVDAEYVVGVGYVEGPPGSEGELEAFLTEGDGAQFVAEGDTVSVDTTDHDGRRAVDVVVAVEGIATKVRMVPVGTRLYMAMVVSPYKSAPGFDRLVESFELVGDPIGVA
ncbi:MAG: hypothetical protein M5U31_14310 [Acidimicrobiia bacterium]|nr:hypothetical protein [Acidimicrobiia bacterium]